MPRLTAPSLRAVALSIVVSRARAGEVPAGNKSFLLELG